MKKGLKREDFVIWHYENDNKVEGIPNGITGDLSGITGNLSGIRGDLSDCEITDEDREKGIDLDDLIVD